MSEKPIPGYATIFDSVVGGGREFCDEARLYLERSDPVSETKLEIDDENGNIVFSQDSDPPIIKLWPIQKGRLLQPCGNKNGGSCTCATTAYLAKYDTTALTAVIVGST
jgi:hypothetical protein